MFGSTYELTGLAPVRTTGPVMHPLETGATHVPGRFSLDNPMVVFGGILALTLGLIGVSGTVRVAGAKASASVGKD